MVTLNAIVSQQAASEMDTEADVDQLLDYVATHPPDDITYRASVMIFAAHSDSSYLKERLLLSRAGYHIFL